MTIEYDSDLGCYVRFRRGADPADPDEDDLVFPTYEELLTIPIVNRVWKTRDGREMFVGEMSRTHVQNSLNWCIRHRSKTLYGFDDSFDDRWKDGFMYQDWEAAFLARLLDPECI